MRLRKSLMALGLAAIVSNTSWADDGLQPVSGILGRRSQPCPCTPYSSAAPALLPGTSTTPPAAGATPSAVDAAQAPTTDFAQPERLGTGSVSQFTPTMFGDLLASQVIGPLTVQTQAGGNRLFILQRGLPIPATAWLPGSIFNFDIRLSNGYVVPAGTPLPYWVIRENPPSEPLPPEPTQPNNNNNNNQRFGNANGLQAIIARGVYKIAENESPAPMDRAYVTYNYYYDVGQIGTTGVRTDVHRETLGLEKTILDGAASVGVRLPFFQVLGDDAFQQSGIGDLSFIFKYGVYDNTENGLLASVGLAVTVPTGKDFTPAFQPNVHPVLLQPFVGGIYRTDRFFVQGFSSLLVPTDSQDVTVFFNDLGAGYYIYRTYDTSRFINYIAPIVEGHLSTPLNNRGSLNQPFGGIDIFSITTGASVGIGPRAFLNIGANVPLTGPQPYGVEALVQLNWRF